MVSRWRGAAVAAIVLVGLMADTVTAAPSLRVVEPSDGAVLARPDVTVRGTASGPMATWLQADRASFDAGTKENVLVDPSGQVRLSTRLADDFDDNSFDASRWTKRPTGAIDAYEKDGALHLSGECSTGGTWGSRVWVLSKATASKYVQSTLRTISGSGDGFVSCVFLYDGDSNYAGVGTQYEPDQYGKGLHVITSAHISGHQHYNAHGLTDASPHTYKVTYSSGAAGLYQDDVLIETIGLTMTHPVVLYTCGARSMGDPVEAVWDDLETGYADGALTSTVHDALCPAPVLRSVDWGSSTPGGTEVEVSVRSSDLPDMRGASGWTLLSPGQTMGLPAAARYLQYRARLLSGDGTATPTLSSVRLDYQVPVLRVEARADASAPWALAAGTESWTVALSLPEGASTVWVRATDARGGANLTSIRVYVDARPPSGRVVINDGDAFTTDVDVRLRLIVQDEDVVEMQLGEAPDLAGAVWTEYLPSRGWTLPSGDGPKTVYARFRDSIGTVSAIASDSIVLDTQPPVGSITINHGVMYTNSTEVVLRLRATDLAGVSDMMVSEHPQLKGADWAPYSPSMMFVLSAGDGAKRVYARFRDLLGHESQAIYSSIILDTRPPVLFITINDGAPFNSTGRVTLALRTVDTAPVTGVQLSEDPFFAGVSVRPFADRVPWQLSPGDGRKFVYGLAFDAVGNIGPVAWASIVLDTTPPVLVLSIDDGAELTNATSVTVSISTEEEHGPTWMWLGLDPSLEGAVPEGFGSPIALTLPAGDGAKTVYARAADPAGNVGPVASDSIVLDTTPPTLAVTIDGGARSTPSRDLSVRLDAFDGSGVDLMRVGEDPLPLGGPATSYERDINWTLSPGDGARTLWCAVRDRAGNWGEAASASIVLDTAPPFSTISATNPTRRSVTALVSWNATDGLSDVRSYDVQYRDGYGNWVDWQTSTCSTSASFDGERGHSYDLRARAVDGLGNAEPFPEDASRFAHVTIPTLPTLHLGSTLLWLIVIVLTALCIGSGYYAWDRRKARLGQG